VNTCCWILNREKQCGEEATLFRNLFLCEDHIKDYFSRMRQTALQSAEHHELSDFPGLCYVALLSSGKIKIGYSNTEKLLHKRIQNLGYSTGGPVVVLKTMRGGFVAEAVLHERFKEHRVPGNGELFEYCSEIADFVSQSE